MEAHQRDLHGSWLIDNLIHWSIYVFPHGNTITEREYLSDWWEWRGGKVKGARILRCTKVLSEIGDGQKREHSMAHKALAIQLDTIASFPGRLGEANSVLMNLELETLELETPNCGLRS